MHLSSDRPAPATAIFDLDRTLTRRDTLLPYMAIFLARHPRRWLRLWRLPLEVARFAIGRVDRDGFKERVIAACFQGATRDEIARCTDAFVENLCATGLRTDARAALEWHRDRGDRLVLLSASVDLYVEAIASRLGFAECTCTGTSWNGARLSGRFSTANRRGDEKARVVRELRGRQPGHVTAYADSHSDLSHLALADAGVLVNGSRRARRAAARLGVAAIEWS